MNTNTNELRNLAEASLSDKEPWYSAEDLYQAVDNGYDNTYIAAVSPATVLGLMDEIDRLRTEAVAADIRIANDALVIAELRAERDALARCKLADQDAYVAMCDQRDAAQADAKRLEWLSRQGVSFGFQDIHEGNKWEIGGPYATLRIAIDAEMKGE